MIASQIKKATENKVEKIDCRSNFFWVRDEDGNLRLGHIYRGIKSAELLRAIETTKTYGTIIEKAKHS